VTVQNSNRRLGDIVALVFDTGLVLGLAIATFATSYSTIATFIGLYGKHGAVQYVGAACPDILCIIGVREYMRDRRIGREIKHWISYPMIVCAVGLFETVTFNHYGDINHALSTSEADWWNGALSFLITSTLILVMMVIHRRESGPRAAARPVTAESREPGNTEIEAPGNSGPGTAGAGNVGPETAVAGNGASGDAGQDKPKINTPPAKVPETIISGGADEESAAPWTPDELNAWALDTRRANGSLSVNEAVMLLKTHPRGGARRATIAEAVKYAREHSTEAGQNDPGQAVAAGE
jgi:hypothetical protein